MTSRLFGTLVLGAVFACLFGGRAEAVCLGLGCSCTIATSDHSFGSYDPLSGLASDSTSSVDVTCGAFLLDVAIGYDISLSTGLSGSYSERRMSSGGNQLGYNLYTTADRSVVWGNGGSGSAIVSDNYILAQNPTIRSYTAYGRIPGGQLVPAGIYVDTILATVTF